MNTTNFVYYGNILTDVMTKVLPMKLIRNKEERQLYKIKVLNVLSVFTTAAIKQTLANYLETVNVAPEDRKYIKMKNEFYFSRVIITFAKKSYIGLQLRQEAHVYDPPKLEVKGVNFFKSTASENTTNFIYEKILMGELLTPKDDHINLARTLSKIKKFQDKMSRTIKDGDMGYLKRSIKVKSPDAYAKPMGNGAYKAVFVWNHVCSQKDLIELPATVTLVKVKLQKKADVAKLERWPKIYTKMMDLFENHPDVGDYEKVDKDTGKITKVKGKGIKAVALPTEMDEIPDWVLSIIDTETLVNDNMNLFTQLYRPLGMVPGTVSHNGAAMKYYTNIIRI